MPSTPFGASLPTPRTRLLTIVLIAVLMATGFLASAPKATAATASRGTASTSSTPQAPQHTMTARERFAQKADRVLRVTRYHKGDPYRYGGSGPHSNQVTVPTA